MRVLVLGRRACLGVYEEKYELGDEGNSEGIVKRGVVS